MAQLTTLNSATATNPDRQREVSVLVMLTAVPVIWAVLILPLMELSLGIMSAAIGLAAFAGLFAGGCHEFYSHHASPLPQRG